MQRDGIEVGPSDGGADLDGILALQRTNLAVNLDPAEVVRDGFVTVVHTRPVLEAMHARAPSIVARRDGAVVGYALAMALECGPLVSELGELFALMDRLRFDGRPLLDHRCYVMGQVCVAREHRGAGLFDALYAAHRRIYAPRFDVLVTDVAERNHRSRRAHERVGFHEIHRYTDEVGATWLTIALDLRSPA